MNENQRKSDLDQQMRIDEICDSFEKSILSDESVPELADLLKRTAPADREKLLIELIRLEEDYCQRGEIDTPRSVDEYVSATSAVMELTSNEELTSIVSSVLDSLKNDENAIEETIDSSSASDRSNEAVSGTRVRYFGDYELIDELARGGMGVVYRAKQISLNRVIALKMILAGSFAGEEQIRRFKIEAESAANLDHPGIVPIYDIGTHKDQHYFSMKLIEGRSLADLGEQEKLSPTEAVQMVRQIADAVHHAHQRGILHRDLKPGNILIDENGLPVVTDFGLARQTDTHEDAATRETLTQAGMVVGTPGFMSPEQARGTDVTTATDIYSLGAILYKLLCGHLPHSGNSVMDTVMSVINDPPTPPSKHYPDIDRDLELICLKCLAMEPEDRYASAAEFAEELDAHMNGRPLKVRAPSLIELTRMWLSSNYGSIAWVPVIAGVIGVVTGLSLWLATLGGDSHIYLDTYDRFPVAERPFMLFSWTLPRQLWFVLYCVALMSIGWWTARLVKTTSRAADFGGGLSVGLLSGLICLVAGYAPMSIASGQVAMADDLTLLESLITQESDQAMEEIELLYPTVKAQSEAEAAAILKSKILGDLRYTTLPRFWVATLIIVGGLGIIGVVQTMVAGPLIRNTSHSQAAFSYMCFSIGLITLIFPFWCELSIRQGSGGYGYIIDWTLPLVSALLSLATIFVVAKNFPIWIQTATTITAVYTFGYFLFFVFLAVPPPAIAGMRRKIAHAQAAVQREPDNSMRRQYLANWQFRFGTALDEARCYDQAEQKYNQAIAQLDSIEVEDEQIRKQKLQTIVAASAIALRKDRTEKASKWIARAELNDVEPSEFLRDILLLKAQILGANDEAENLSKLLGTVDPQNRKSVLDSFQLIRRSTDGRRFTLKHHEDELHQWTTSIVNRINWTEGSSTIDRELADRWMKSRARWKLYGPYSLPNATEASVFEKPLPIEKTLLEPAEITNQNPITEVTTYPVKPIDLIDSLGQQEFAIAYATSEFSLDDDKTIKFLIRSDDGIRVWIDGKLIHNNPAKRHINRDLDQVDVPLKKGKHLIVAKISQGTERWEFGIDAATLNWRCFPLWQEYK